MTIYLTLLFHVVLSTCPQNKEQLVESGCIEAIAFRLNEKDEKLLYNYFTTLRNLSDAEADFVSKLSIKLV